MNYDKKFEEIPCLFMQNHGRVIYSLIRSIRPNVVLEIGAFRGYTSAWISQALKDNSRGQLFIIDNFSLDNSPAELHNNLVSLDLSRNVFINHGDSKDPNLWPDMVDVAIVDGNHSYDYAKSDIMMAVERGACCIILHDTISWWGPRKIVEEGIAGYNMIEFPHDQGLAIFLRELHEKPAPPYSEEKYPKGTV